MCIGILIEDETSRANFELAEADMRRFWSNRCKVHRQFPGKIFIEVGTPVRVRAKMGVERLRSFCVSARVARSTSFTARL